MIAYYAQKFVNHRNKLAELMQKILLAAQTRQKQYWDRNCREADFNERDLVLLDTKNPTVRFSMADGAETTSKLASSRRESFPIIRMLNQKVAKLQLPSKLSRLHPTSNVAFLTQYAPRPSNFRTRLISKSAPVVVDDKGLEFLIADKLLKVRNLKCLCQWLVGWHGYQEYDALANVRKTSCTFRIGRPTDTIQRPPTRIQVRGGGLG
ncbi:hypothetical protein ABG067_007496 [Albugo candida]